MTGAAGADNVERARRFAHMLLFRYLHHVPVVRQRPRALPLLDPSEVDAIVPGADANFDRLLDALIAGGPFL